MSIARFKALSARRRRKDAELDDKIEATIADPADDPAVTMEKKNQSELLRHALTKLSAEHRQIIDLVYYHEQSVDEAAQVLGIPAATVKTRMFYARKKLGEWLKAGCRRAFCWNSMWRNLQRHEVIESSGEVNWLIDGPCGERLPAIDLAHVDLTGGEQRPEQHGGSLC